ncbi:hypothetical protein AEAC466_16705 [Asticcacaulis sp. AC466]|nr:hypothetical protein AEAC466_16705 [Asticcacaulis sp. AC466]
MWGGGRVLRNIQDDIDRLTVQIGQKYVETRFSLDQACEIFLPVLALKDDQIAFPMTEGVSLSDIFRSMFYVTIQRDV